MTATLQHLFARRAGLIVEHVLVHCLGRQFRAGLANLASRDTYNSRVRRHILKDDTACSDFGADTDLYIAQYLGASGYQYARANFSGVDRQSHCLCRPESQTA